MLVDTHVLVWRALEPDRLSAAASQAIDDRLNAGGGIVCLSASFWELAIKVAKGRLDLGMPVSLFFQLCQQSEGLEIIDTTASQWIASAELQWTHRDPIDRLLVATAEQLNLQLITADTRIHDLFSRCVW